MAALAQIKLRVETVGARIQGSLSLPRTKFISGSPGPRWASTLSLGLLPAQVEVALARREMAVAESAAAELDEIAVDFDTTALHAAAAGARATVAVARGELGVALRSAREALRLWQEIELPYEAAQSRLALAEALSQAGERDQAQLELRAAHAAFVRLGAGRDAQLV